MFLFTTPTASAPPAAPPALPTNPVVDAIRDGAQRTGAGFDYLLATAQRESALDPKARNGSSSATGLFQFIEQTWLGTMKADGAKLGLGDFAAAITAKSDGTYAVGDAAAKQQILGLRQDPQVASTMAGALTQRNRDYLAGELGREPNSGDLYAAHVLGARGAANLIKTAQASPTSSAAADFPEAAAVNRSIFYDRAGRARGAGEVYALLGANQPAAAAPAAAPVPTASTTTGPSFGANQPLAYARQDGPIMHSLFQTDNRRGPISDSVAKLWQARTNQASAEPRSLYFPRSDAASDDIVDQPSAGQPVVAQPAASGTAESFAAPLASAPLPPRRPDGLTSVTVAPAPVPQATSEPARLGSAKQARSAGPLDLSAFMRWRRS